MEKVIITSSIPLHISPLVGCGGVMVINENMRADEVTPKPEIKAVQDVVSLDDETNQTNP